MATHPETETNVPSSDPDSQVIDITRFTGQVDPVVQSDEYSFRHTLDKVVVAVGQKLGGDTLIKARRRGAAVLAAGAMAAGGLVIHRGVETYDYMNGSNIPGTEQHLNPAEDHLVPVPQSGAFNLAATVDPAHAPANGVHQFEQQLGHLPEPGDMVAVPGVASDK